MDRVNIGSTEETGRSESHSSEGHRTVTYDAAYPNGVTVKTVLTAEWAQDAVTWKNGHPVFDYAWALHEKRAPSSIELLLLDTLAPK